MACQSRREFLCRASAAAVAAALPAVQPEQSLAAAPARWTPTEPANQPLGQAKGLFPGRVVWIHDPRVAQWDGDTSGCGWLDDQATDPVHADRMLRQSLRLLTGAANEADAWAALFRHFNQTHARGDRGYRPGERVAVKLNLNCAKRTREPKLGPYNTPQLTLALLRQLVHQAGVRETDIVVCDASRWVNDAIFLPAHAEFPGIRFEDRDGGEGRFLIQPDKRAAIHFGDPSTPDSGKTFLPTSLTGATYLINGALLKGHSLAGVTLCAKNHFGSVYRENPGRSDPHQGWNPGHMHSAIMTEARAMGTYNPLVDLMGHKHLGGKTMLYLIEGFYAAPHQSPPAQKWQSAPFNGHWTGSLFASQDPVAIESVAVDFFAAEPTATRMVGAVDNYLHEAALAHRPPSGTRYAPAGDGRTLASLGVHEHWNSPEKKQYSRNLGSGQGIELVKGA